MSFKFCTLGSTDDDFVTTHLVFRLDERALQPKFNKNRTYHPSFTALH